MSLATDYGFGIVEAGKLAGARPELVRAAAELRTNAAARGITFAITSGVRSTAKQAALYAEFQRGERPGPVARPGSSMHEYGAAFDVAVTAHPDGWTDADALAALGEEAPRVGLRWGGTFTTPDPAHFALAESLEAARAAYTPTLAEAANVAGRSLPAGRCRCCGAVVPARVGA